MAAALRASPVSVSPQESRFLFLGKLGIGRRRTAGEDRAGASRQSCNRRVR
jgi:hypothetical protein